MQGREPPPDVQAQPEQGRQLRIGQVGVKVVRHVEKGLLKNVRRVDAGPQPRIDAKLDHAPEPVAVLVEQLGERPAFATLEPLEEIGRIAHGVIHVCPHTPLSVRSSKTGTEKPKAGRPGPPCLAVAFSGASPVEQYQATPHPMYSRALRHTSRMGSTGLDELDSIGLRNHTVHCDRQIGWNVPDQGSRAIPCPPRARFKAWLEPENPSLRATCARSD